MTTIECPIDCEPFNDDDDVVATPCGHIFHRECLVLWLQDRETCPQCRRRVCERQLLRLYLQTGDNREEATLQTVLDLLQEERDKCAVLAHQLTIESERAQAQALDLTQARLRTEHYIELLDVERAEKQRLAAEVDAGKKAALSFIEESEKHLEKMKRRQREMKAQLKDEKSKNSRLQADLDGAKSVATTENKSKRSQPVSEQDVNPQYAHSNFASSPPTPCIKTQSVSSTATEVAPTVCSRPRNILPTAPKPLARSRHLRWPPPTAS